MKKRLIAVLCALLTAVSAVLPAAALEGEAQRAADTLLTLGLTDTAYHTEIDIRIAGRPAAGGSGRSGTRGGRRRLVRRLPGTCLPPPRRR